MILERTIEAKKHPDHELQEQLTATQIPADIELKNVFGGYYDSTISQEQWFHPNTENISREVIQNLLQVCLDVLVNQQKILMDAEKVQEANEVDAYYGQGELTITDFQRAIEFADLKNVRKNSDAFVKVWDAIVQEVRENISDYIAMYAKPRFSVVHPKGSLADRKTWSRHRETLMSKVADYLDKIDQFVYLNIIIQSSNNRLSE